MKYEQTDLDLGWERRDINFLLFFFSKPNVKILFVAKIVLLQTKYFFFVQPLRIKTSNSWPPVFVILV